MMTYFLIGVIMALIVAAIAQNKGFDTGAWFFFGLILWPVAFFVVLLKDPAVRVAEKAALESNQMKKCPDCAELVKQEARKCRFCNFVFSEAPLAAPSAKLEWGSKSTATPRKFASSWKPK